MRAVLRFVASVMIVSGTLLIADAAVTLLWQEPVSAYVAERHQVKLRDSFFDPHRRVIRRRPGLTWSNPLRTRSPKLLAAMESGWMKSS